MIEEEPQVEESVTHPALKIVVNKAESEPDDIKEIVECVCAYAENRKVTGLEPREDDNVPLTFDKYIECMANNWQILKENDVIEHFWHH